MSTQSPILEQAPGRSRKVPLRLVALLTSLAGLVSCSLIDRSYLQAGDGSSGAGGQNRSGTGGDWVAAPGGVGGSESGGTSAGGGGLSGTTGGQLGVSPAGGVGNLSVGGTTSTGGVSGAGGWTGSLGGSGGLVGTGGLDGEGGEVNLTDALRVYYAFDTDSGSEVTDSSGNAKHGVVAGGAATWISPGRVKGALDLDGKGTYVTLPDGIVNGASAITIALWVKYGGQLNHRIFDLGQSSIIRMSLKAQTLSGPPEFSVGTASTFDPVLMGVAALKPEWTHLAITLSPPNGKLFVNGMAVASQSKMALRPLDLGETTSNYLGRSIVSGEPFLKATLDEFRIYDRVLLNKEIRALAAMGSP